MASGLWLVLSRTVLTYDVDFLYNHAALVRRQRESGVSAFAVRVQLIAPNNRECIVIVTLPYVLTHAPVCVARSTVPLNGTGLDRHDLVAAAVETLIEMALRHAGDPQTCAELVARTGLRFGLVSGALGRMLTAGKLRQYVIAPLTSVYLLAETP